MDVTATTKFARMSPTKMRDIVKRMRGLPAQEALNITKFSCRKGALIIGKTLYSAIKNAENNDKLSIDDLIVKEAIVNDGPRMRRYWARARGSASPIRKRMSHVRIVLTDGKE